MVDALHKLFDAGEGAAADCLVGDQREEALDLIEPGAVGLANASATPPWVRRVGTIFFTLKRNEPFRDSSVDYEALSVQRNAPRWIKALTRFGFIPAAVRPSPAQFRWPSRVSASRRLGASY